MTAFVDGADLRPCRPCEAFAVSADRRQHPAHQIQRATVAVTWPPDTITYIYPRNRPTIVWTCEPHQRWTRWPSALSIALARETEDLTMPEPAPESALEATLRRKREQDMGGRVPHRHGYGSLPGQSVDVLIATYREAGTFEGAARLLTERHVRSFRGKRWCGSTVRSMILGYV